MSDPTEAIAAAEREAATFQHARREALLVMGLWVVALVYTITYCGLNGYQDGSQPLQMIWGIPKWVFYGIVAPWIVAVVFTVWFCFWYMADDDLGEDEVTHIEHGEGELDAT